ncbi:MAG TPA: MarR family transcriptional regulator [Lactovum miscens]|uniref:MarR family winged helix-turn-helix transcriptional regulator n=1 Tax=Lactovum miscens TaxID=190387 RepID=UPI002EDAE841
MKKKELRVEIRKELKRIISKDHNLQKLRKLFHEELPAPLFEVYQKLSKTDLAVLYANKGENLRAKDIVERIDVTQSAISKSIARLEKYGLVIKIPHPSNKKEFFIQNTLDGETIAQVRELYNSEQSHRFKKVSDQFSESDLKTVFRFLAQLNGEFAE